MGSASECCRPWVRFAGGTGAGFVFLTLATLFAGGGSLLSTISTAGLTHQATAVVLGGGLGVFSLLGLITLLLTNVHDLSPYFRPKIGLPAT